MKRDILKLNYQLYRIMFCFSLFYFGFFWGKFYPSKYVGLSDMIFPGIHLFLLLVSYKMSEEEAFLKVRGVLAMGICTVLYMVAFWFLWILDLRKSVHKDYWDFIIYPGVQVLISIVILIGYVVCAVKLHKENKIYKL